MFSPGFTHPSPQDLTATYCVLVLALYTWCRWPRASAAPTLSRAERHALNVERSHALLRSLPREDAIGALRQVSAHEFEEVVLTALARRGHRITRSPRYTGDGGWDGEVRVRGRRFLVQSKRYAGPIRAEHIDAFRRTCREERARGLFVHTGTMGPLSLAADRRARRVVVVHGEALERLMAGRRVRLGRLRL